MSHGDHTFFTMLALVVAVLGSWTALDLFRRVRSHIGQARRMWLAAAAVAMGFSIWSMHFIAMLGFDPGSPVSYDPFLTLLSLALAIGATCGAFFWASRERPSPGSLLVAGLAMGGGICLMHYVGMMALRSAVSLGYRPGYVAASFAVAAVAATAALLAAGRERSPVWRLGASVILGFAIVGMHYTAMAGLILTPTEDAGDIIPGAPPQVLSLGVAAGTAVILALGLLASFYDQRLNVLTALEAGGVGYWEMSLPDRRLQASPGAKAVLGLPRDAPLTHDAFLAMLDSEDRPGRDELFTTTLAGGGDYDAEYRISTASGEVRWVNIRGRVVDHAGGARRISGVMLDVTDRRQAFTALAEADRRHQLMIAELNHRVKNTLATVQSISSQTAKGATSIAAFRDAFEARLLALSNTHNALTRGSWSGASLREIVEQELSPYAAEQYRLNGADVSLSPTQALSLGMMVHELTTNAVKHGALSAPSGCVHLSWSVAEPGRLVLDWTERDGPPVQVPERRGFGSRLMEATVAQLNGVAAYDYAADGFTCQVSVPLVEPASAYA